jgi:hypothetical protein
MDCSHLMSAMHDVHISAVQPWHRGWRAGSAVALAVLELAPRGQDRHLYIGKATDRAFGVSSTCADMNVSYVFLRDSLL